MSALPPRGDPAIGHAAPADGRRAGRVGRGAGAAGRLALAWLPLFALWVLFVRIFVGLPIRDALTSGFVAISNAAVLGLGVWWLSGRYRWPQRVRPRFYAAHALAGGVYSGAWILSGHFIALAQTGEGTLGMLVASSLIGWRFLMGLWLYGLVAGVSYALRIRRRLGEQEAIAARAEKLALEARLESLRAQLNPHFLFNALHTVRALVRANPDAARDGLEKLGHLLRGALESDAGGTVSLAEEWDFASDYLDLERLRLGDRLNVTHGFSSEAARCRVPPFVIQSLVENAVRHGVAPKPDGGTIAVTASVDGRRLRISVADDGVGAAETAGGAGRGLKLLRDRLAALHGTDASVSIATRVGHGFEVRVELPASR